MPRTRTVVTVDSKRVHGSSAYDTIVKELSQTTANILSPDVNRLPRDPLVVVRIFDRICGYQGTPTQQGAGSGRTHPSGVEQLHSVEECIGQVERDEGESA